MANVTAILKKTPYRVEIKTHSGNTILADEPLEKGGQNAGPYPHELLASALSSCILITLRMYADRKGWDIGDVEISTTLEWNREENKTAIFSTVQFSGQLNQDQRTRLIKIAESCPIHKIITHPVDSHFVVGERD